MISVIELFGGIGAPRRALETLSDEIKIVDYVEIDKFAAKSYNLLYNQNHKTQSVSDITYKIDLLIHGSPCQDFSIAGLQRGGEKNSNTRSSLLWESVRIIKELGHLKPKVVVWENVKGVLNKNNINVFNSYLEEMEKLGYKNSYEVLDARDFGVPQARKRVFVVSVENKETFDFNKLQRREMRDIKTYLEEEVEDRYLIKAPSMFKYIKSGRVKEIKDYSYTLVTNKMARNGPGFVNTKKGPRVLTPKESLRLMGFLDSDYEKIKDHISETQIYKQAGNSIVVDVLIELFRVILKDYLNKDIKDVNERY